MLDSVVSGRCALCSASRVSKVYTGNGRSYETILSRHGKNRHACRIVRRRRPCHRRPHNQLRPPLAICLACSRSGRRCLTRSEIKALSTSTSFGSSRPILRCSPRRCTISQRAVLYGYSANCSPPRRIRYERLCGDKRASPFNDSLRKRVALPSPRPSRTAAPLYRLSHSFHAPLRQRAHASLGHQAVGSRISPFHGRRSSTQRATTSSASTSNRSVGWCGRT